ncbi:MAG: hypothetical protein ACK5Q2_14370 [Bacteroidota bacterium]
MPGEGRCLVQSYSFFLELVQDSLTESKTARFSPFFTLFQLPSTGYAPSKTQKLTKNEPVLPPAENPEQALNNIFLRNYELKQGFPRLNGWYVTAFIALDQTQPGTARYSIRISYHTLCSLKLAFRRAFCRIMTINGPSDTSPSERILNKLSELVQDSLLLAKTG